MRAKESAAMNIRDVMTARVVVVSPDDPVSLIAGVMAKNGINAVPVVDDSGAPIGIVSDGDLVARDEAARLQRREWWLGLLAAGERPEGEAAASLASSKPVARDVMSAPVVTIAEATDPTDAARLLAAHRIKRVPVVHDGRIVGIVSRADLVRLLANAPAQPAHPVAPQPHRAAPAHAADAALAPAAELTVETFRGLVEHARREAAERDEMARRAAQEARRKAVEALVEHHLTDEGWRSILNAMRAAAERGEREFMLLRFPSALCSDGGRAVNVPEPRWPQTLRGEAAEMYLRWERDLRSHGFRISARILDFPGGFPGDVGLFLVWGE